MKWISAVLVLIALGIALNSMKPDLDSLLMGFMLGVIFWEGLKRSKKPRNLK